MPTFCFKAIACFIRKIWPLMQRPCHLYILNYYYYISCSQHAKTVRLGVHRKKGKKGQEDQEKVHVFGVLGKSGSRERITSTQKKSTLLSRETSTG